MAYIPGLVQPGLKVALQFELRFFDTDRVIMASSCLRDLAFPRKFGFEG